MIILNVDIPYQSATDRIQRERRISFYRKNGITDTGYELADLKHKDYEPMAVLSSDVQNFNAQEYEDYLNSVFLQSEASVNTKRVGAET